MQGRRTALTHAPSFHPPLPHSMPATQASFTGNFSDMKQVEIPLGAEAKTD